MKVKAMVVQDRMEKWFSGSPEEKEVRVFTLLDLEEDSHMEMMPDTFDYRPNKEEEAAIPLGKARMNAIDLTVRKFQTNKAGRVCMFGRILTFGGKPFGGNGNGATAPQAKANS